MDTTIEITEEEYQNLSNDDGGFCLACDEEAYGIEPDARRYQCESCEAHQVYGVEELLIMGKIEFVEE